MTPDPLERAPLAQALLASLAAASPGSSVALRGSLARGTADPWSDIDLLWIVPDAAFDAAVASVRDALAVVRPVAALRSDPDLQRSGARRLFYARLEGVPLFWRVDLAVFVASVGEDWAYDLDNPTARGEAWSWPESALANAVAAVRAARRGRLEEGAALVARAAERIGLNLPAGDLPFQIRVLAAAAAEREPHLYVYAADVTALAQPRAGPDAEPSAFGFMRGTLFTNGDIVSPDFEE